MIPMNDSRSAHTHRDTRTGIVRPPLLHTPALAFTDFQIVSTHAFNGFSEPQRHLTANAVSCCMSYLNYFQYITV